MLTALVNSDNHFLHYEDSGAPAGSTDYTTLIVVHGTAYHSPIFRPILPFAAQNNLRIILVNRRDYPGSSFYTKGDLANVTAKDANGTPDNERARSFFRARAAEFTNFMRWIVEHENIPKISEDRKKGGLALLAWSAGNAYTIPVLAYADEVPKETRNKLEPYFRKLVLFDASRWTVSPPVTENDDPLRDESLSHEQRAQYFNEWVAAYYTHKDPLSRNVDNVKTHLSEADAFPPPTTKTISAHELAIVADFVAVRNSEVLVRGGDPKVLEEQARRALFDDTIAQKAWPRVEVEVIWCEKTAWVLIGGVWALQTYQEEAAAKGVKGRPVRFSMFPGANHFPHWDIPEKTISVFAEIIGT